MYVWLCGANRSSCFGTPIICNQTDQLVSYSNIYTRYSMEFAAAIYFGQHLRHMSHVEWIWLCFPFTTASAFVVHFI